MRPSRWHALLVLPLVIVAGALALSGDHRFPATGPLPGPPVDSPRVLVALGDSTVSGEGAGNYEPGTDGEAGNWCHRSSSASIHRAHMPGVAGTINLACSGAPSAQVGLGAAIQYTEPSQAERLARVASENRVVAVVVAAGANDEPGFSHVLDQCVQAWFSRSRPGCGDTIGPHWQDRVDAMVPKLVRALRDVRAALRGVGYRDHDYELILQSYAAPVGPDVAEGLQDLSGCPFRSEDLRWVRDAAVPALTAGLRQAARLAGARFLDLSRAGAGREACSSRDPDREWFRRLAVDWSDLHSDERATHALQESFHPNANGHAQFGRCLAEFLNTPDRAAACLSGPDGNLHSATTIGD
ncbi:MAG TPA: GDSL-type esterase/lipase family protein [Actinophytocola sp.]|uniref:GDSL-type esterase/lipase family protein n=1 Tax=Actinophytocola sp. TaxID=1872138 RepID=UPI002DDC98FB|nr:GDSL-type esterase/lipase family protein [Actinophytocola sp.]HEV2780555.1 GDSL-type esterase/lipase family protein [Actinophytocola sp.]